MDQFLETSIKRNANSYVWGDRQLEHDREIDMLEDLGLDVGAEVVAASHTATTRAQNIIASCIRRHKQLVAALTRIA